MASEPVDMATTKTVSYEGMIHSVELDPISPFRCIDVEPVWDRQGLVIDAHVERPQALKLSTFGRDEIDYIASLSKWKGAHQVHRFRIHQARIADRPCAWL